MLTADPVSIPAGADGARWSAGGAVAAHPALPAAAGAGSLQRGVQGWQQLVLSLDPMRRRQLCLGVLQHRPRNWPNRPGVEPPSWRDACKQHCLASKTWTRNMQDPGSSTCLSLFRRRKGHHRLPVGAGGDFGSLRAALAADGPYDRLVLLPGVQEEQSEVLPKVPVELVGQGRLGSWCCGPAWTSTAPPPTAASWSSCLCAPPRCSAR